MIAKFLHMMALFLCIGGCGHSGAKVNVCVVDAPAEGFQCSEAKKKTETFIPFSKGSNLNCISPSDLEQGLKLCQKGILPTLTLCKISEYSPYSFTCITPVNESYNITPEQADNYACLSDRDKKRILERCHK